MKVVLPTNKKGEAKHLPLLIESSIFHPNAHIPLPDAP